MAKTPKTNNKDINTLIKKATKAGWRFDYTKGKHVRGLAPNGEGIVIVAVSPSSHRAYQEFRNRLKKNGLKDV